ncbi:hypothetical protein BH24ACT5_BH24ACT5_22140 [soil metagenome]
MNADQIERLVEQAIGAVGSLARRGSTLTTGVAVIAGVVSIAAYLVGLAAFDGGARAVWAVVGAVLVVAAAGAPLLASMRLRRIPRQATALHTELRALLGRSDEARRVVVETVAHEPDDDLKGDGAESEPLAASASRTPAVVVQSQRFHSLRQLAATSGDVKTLASVTASLASLPGLVAVGLVGTGIAAVAGFILTLIWIF